MTSAVNIIVGSRGNPWARSIQLGKAVASSLPKPYNKLAPDITLKNGRPRPWRSFSLNARARSQSRWPPANPFRHRVARLKNPLDPVGAAAIGDASGQMSL
jgi:hypothetical protein